MLGLYSSCILACVLCEECLLNDTSLDLEELRLTEASHLELIQTPTYGSHFPVWHTVTLVVIFLFSVLKLLSATDSTKCMVLMITC